MPHLWPEADKQTALANLRAKQLTEQVHRSPNPKQDAELKTHLWDSLQIKLPDTQVCPNHSTPFRAFADAYFARSSVAVWKASRGFGGKSHLLALLGHCEADTLGAEVTVLGGSGEQSTRVLEYLQKWARGEENVQRRTRYASGGMVTALMASTKSARGPHPQRLRLDEVDEMDLMIFDAAMGQPMSTPTIAKQTVLSSTHHYPDATFTEVLKRADENGWPVYEWSIAQGSRVLTQRGWVPIECLDALSDCVWTRNSWRRIRHVTWMGNKPVREFVFKNGARLKVTTDHRILAPGGWVRAEALACGSPVVVSTVIPQADTAVPSIVSGCAVSIFGSIFMPRRTVGFCDLCGDVGRPIHIYSMLDRLQVVRPDTATIAAEMIQFNVWRNRPNPYLIGQSVRTLFTRPMIHESVSIRTEGESPEPAAGAPLDSCEQISGIERDRAALAISPISAPLTEIGAGSLDRSPAFAVSHVASITDGVITLPVWDIGVEGEHEFVVESVLVHNCWRETSAEPDGWLNQAEIQSKRGEVTAAMWAAEYDLQEPSPEGRAILPEKVTACFRKELGQFEGRAGEEVVIEQPQSGARYVHGCDWGKEKDWTVIDTLRVDCRPMRRVAWLRINRMEWPVMIRKFNERVQRYGGQACHDKTGIGNVVDGYITVQAEGVVLVGQVRADVFTNYIAAIENGTIESPAIKYCEGEHRYCTNDDLRGSGHPPDSFVAGAMAYRATQQGSWSSSRMRL